MVALALPAMIRAMIGHRTIVPIHVRRQPGWCVGTTKQLRQLMRLAGQADADARAEHDEQKCRNQRQSANTCESEAESGHRNQRSEPTHCYTITAKSRANAYQRADLRNRNAFITTDTDDRLIANAAIIGLSSRPNAGYKAPAAIGTPSAL